MMKPPEMTLWAFDFDGTISDLVPDRRDAQIDPTCHELLLKLASRPENLVAILSSRELDDLVSRVRIPGAFMAGSSGLELRTPDGRRLRPGSGAAERLLHERARILPALKVLEQRSPGVDIEDKHWSAAVHYRNARAADRQKVVTALGTLNSIHGVPMFHGPEVVEVQFLPGVDKARTLRTIVHTSLEDNSGVRVNYAGDDQSDVHALRWALTRDGAALIVGKRIKLTGARYVERPTQLAAAVSAMYDELLTVEPGGR